MIQCSTVQSGVSHVSIIFMSTLVLLKILILFFLPFIYLFIYFLHIIKMEWNACSCVLIVCMMQILNMT